LSIYRLMHRRRRRCCPKSKNAGIATVNCGRTIPSTWRWQSTVRLILWPACRKPCRKRRGQRRWRWNICWKRSSAFGWWSIMTAWCWRWRRNGKIIRRNGISAWSTLITALARRSWLTSKFIAAVCMVADRLVTPSLIRMASSATVDVMAAWKPSPR